MIQKSEIEVHIFSGDAIGDSYLCSGGDILYVRNIATAAYDTMVSIEAQQGIADFPVSTRLSKASIDFLCNLVVDLFFAKPSDDDALFFWSADAIIEAFKAKYGSWTDELMAEYNFVANKEFQLSDYVTRFGSPYEELPIAAKQLIAHQLYAMREYLAVMDQRLEELNQQHQQAE